MNLIATSGPISGAMSNLRNLIAASSNFQTWVGASDAADAKTYVHYFGIDAPAEWAASTAYKKRDHVFPTTANGFLYQATTAGTSGAAEPTWRALAGATVSDGSVVWTAHEITGLEGEVQNAAARASRPMVLLGPLTPATFSMAAIYQGQMSGECTVIVQDAVSSTYTAAPSNAGLDFANRLGALIADLFANAKDHLLLTDVEIVELGRTPGDLVTAMGDFWEAVLAVKIRGGVLS